MTQWAFGSAELVVALVIILFVLVGATQSAQFFDGLTWINILRNTVFVAIAGCFTTIVLVNGGLDLSIGSVFMAGAVGGAAVADAGYGNLLAFLAGIGIGAAVGLLNGLLINYAQMPAIIVTLGTLFAVRALAVTLTQGQPIGPLPNDFAAIGQSDFLGLPLLVYYALIIVVVAYLLLHRTMFGWNVRAIGGNRVAARSMGIRVNRVATSVYVLSGVSAALAGVLMASRLGAGDPTLGNGFELQVIAAAIIGGTSIYGAIGTVPGTVLGALLLSVLTTGLILLKVDPGLQNFAVGVVIIVAAGMDRARKARMFRTSTNVARERQGKKASDKDANR